MSYKAEDFEAYDRVTVSFTGYIIEAIVSGREGGPLGEHRGWLWVVQTTDYEDVSFEDRPEFQVADEYVVPSGEVPVPGPFTPEWFAAQL